ncbi:hypothetical protein TNIN_119001 [Trichonephila inaurata madagascariensis]|uniref:Uncharacterized protein n=1 Tax=Trichonephila inaurata madagascariensis TaxID=2747483 RepID=A0A8X6YSZ7_9ARAC|nr:hypothetical protein TNIN_119001 [Trichonephila inaurata madagascariensis]
MPVLNIVCNSNFWVVADRDDNCRPGEVNPRNHNVPTLPPPHPRPLKEEFFFSDSLLNTCTNTVGIRLPNWYPSQPPKRGGQLFAQKASEHSPCSLASQRKISTPLPRAIIIGPHVPVEIVCLVFSCNRRICSMIGLLELGHCLLLCIERGIVGQLNTTPSFLSFLEICPKVGSQNFSINSSSPQN